MNKNDQEDNPKANNERKPTNIDKRKRKQIAYRARHRLHSIYHDAIRLEFHPCFPSKDKSDFHIVGNQRCGSWYIRDFSAELHHACYFKSTDGHSHFMSWKRLNLHLLKLKGNILLIDSSVRKALPDSCSRTIPIWACVLNRLAVKLRQPLQEHGNNCNNESPSSFWDTKLYTPTDLVSEQEHRKMESVIDDHVEQLYTSGAIVDPKQFLRDMTKPIRPYWITNTKVNAPKTTATSKTSSDSDESDVSQAETTMQEIQDSSSKFKAILCWNPCRVQNRHQWNDTHGYFYTPGAADDEESWARHLTPGVFWKHANTLLSLDRNSNDKTVTLENCDQVDGSLDQVIDKIVQQERQQDHNTDTITTTQDTTSTSNVYAHQIGNLNLWVGSRRGGKPPDCWNHFDGILNVTTLEYDGMNESTIAKTSADENEDCTKKTCRRHFYLQLPIEEGKRDKTQLEHWLPVGLLFLMHHLQSHRRVLVHCAQGKDRSVAVVLAYVVLMCRPLTFPLQVATTNLDLAVLVEQATSSLNEDREQISKKKNTDIGSYYLQSGLLASVVSQLLSNNGHTLFLKWMHSQLQQDDEPKTGDEQTTPWRLLPLATKEQIRIGLQLIRQDREVADPTRSTLQKLNRFFMSNPLYRQEASR